MRMYIEWNQIWIMKMIEPKSYRCGYHFVFLYIEINSKNSDNLSVTPIIDADIQINRVAWRG